MYSSRRCKHYVVNETMTDSRTIYGIRLPFFMFGVVGIVSIIELGYFIMLEGNIYLYDRM